MYNAFTEFVQSLYGTSGPIALHAPVFLGNEKQYLNECIDSTFVSYVGKFVAQFESVTAAYTGANYAVAVVNGTAALQIALQTSGVQPGDEVITQALTFVATANAIAHAGALPAFVDVDADTMGMSPASLSEFLRTRCIRRHGRCIDASTGRAVSAIVPMHTFGHPCRIDEIVDIGGAYGLPVIEDAAEALGTFYRKKHAGTFGAAGILSYNGNKTITTGGGGMILTNDERVAKAARHLTTTAKIPHRWEFDHDQSAYNFRMPNVNAALGVAQMEQIDRIIDNKRETASRYARHFDGSSFQFVREPEGARSNYWLNAVLCPTRAERDSFLQWTNDRAVMTRPAWKLMHTLAMYAGCPADDLATSHSIEQRLVNIPSGYRT